jgi:hypothetical protein
MQRFGMEETMARNEICRRGQASAAVPSGPVSTINQHIAILLMGLFLSLLGSATIAAEQGTLEQRRACTPDVFKHCGEFIPDADRITACLREKIRDLSPDCRIVMTGERKG